MTPPTSHASRIKIKTSLLQDSNRIREDYSHVEDLAASIAERGLIQPIVVTSDYTVIDGGSRLRACRDVLGHTEVDVVFMENMSEAELRILEVEANVRRKDFTWSERVLAVCRVHELKFVAAALSGERWGQRQTGELLGQSLGNVNSCLTLGSLIRQKDKEILACATPADALKLLLRRKEAEASKLLATSTLSGGPSILNANLGKPKAGVLPTLDTSCDDFYGSAPSVLHVQSALGLNSTVAIVAPTFDEMPLDASEATPGAAAPIDTPVISLSQMLLKGDCIEHMKSFNESSIDHVITDIPYGIDMSNLQQANTGMDVSSVSVEHDVNQNVSLMQLLLPAVYRVLKPSGFFAFWYDLDHHEKLQTWATAAGFRVQRWPLVWHKTHSCMNQSAGKNFTKNYEVCMVLSKGNASLTSPQSSSVWMGGNEDVKTLLQHPFVKPFKLWSWLFTALTLPGQTIYDPFAGVGSSTLAAIDFGHRPLASELNEEHFNRLVINVANLYQSKIPNATFN